MVNVSTSSVFDQVTSTIELLDGEEVTRVDKGLIDVDDEVLEVISSWEPLVTSGFLGEFDTLFNVELGGDTLVVWVQASSESDFTHEQVHGLEGIGDNVNKSIAGSEDEHTGGLDEFEFFGADLEGGFVGTGGDVGGGVEVLESGEEEGVTAAESGGVLDSVDDFDGLVVDDVELHGVFLPAWGGEREGGVGWGQRANEGGEELEVVSLVFFIAFKDSVLDGGLHDFGVVLVEDEGLSVVIVVFSVAKETVFREDDMRFRSFGGMLDVVDGTEWVVDLVVGVEIEEWSVLLEDLSGEDAGG